MPSRCGGWRNGARGDLGVELPPGTRAGFAENLFIQAANRRAKLVIYGDTNVGINDFEFAAHAS